MENTTLKAENLKPVLLKAGVPLAVSMAGVIYAWIMAKKINNKAGITEFEEDSGHGTMHEECSHSFSSMEDDEEEEKQHGITIGSHISVPSEKLVIHENHCFEQDIISGLRSRIEGLQMRELALSLQFDRYCDMKEQESLLVEIKNLLWLESARVEFLDKEISFLEAENTKLENFMNQYLKILEQIEKWKSENKILEKKVEKLKKRSNAQRRLIKEQSVRIRAEETEILRSHEALQRSVCVMNKLEDEMREMQRVLDELQFEKNELLKKLHSQEKAYATKIKEGFVSKEDYNKILNELEQIKKERAAEIEELNQLRLSNNSCLNHEEEQEQEHDHYKVLEFEENSAIMHYESDHELHHSFMEHCNNNIPSCFGSTQSDNHHHHDHGFSRRKRLIRRLRRWVEGSDEKVVRVKPVNSDPHHVPNSRNSCSSI
ncbi:uncharacterized protein LOC130962085 [Arachis stenosperma]|uniref:uncharacterized protein LOC130962085 n=1 Tax=Arachis stenosperma TaxID=217475 RepID=UPI0025ACAA03|nr:uncharacterized protein LOC130962085 [Arachis stenosperma]